MNPCNRCGQEHNRCKAHNRAGGPCGNQALRGQKVCRKHGGQSPQAKRAAQRRIADEEALRIVKADATKRLAHTSTIGLDNPLDQLAHIAIEAMAFKDALAARVNALDHVRYSSTEGSEQLRAEIVLYERALDRTHKFLAELTKLGYDERRVKLAEHQGELLATVIQRILDDLDLTETQKAAIPTIVPKHLRLVSGT